jgi:protoheme IX farnesyltransferase
MSETSFATDVRPGLDQPFFASPADYFALLKPRVMSLVVFTAVAGLLLAPTPPHPVIALASLIAIAVGGGASGALNMWYEADIDRLMARTRSRPIPAGRLDADEALAFGLVLAVASIVTLGLVANWLAAALLAFTIFFYVVVYTMWLKRATPMNIVIGGAAGALPPIVAYTAATGEIGLAGLALFAIVFIWTPPHFWALALVKNEDYTRAGVPMLPVVAGEDRTRLEIVLYTLALAPLGLAPYFLGFATGFYGAAAAVLGAAFLWLSWRVYTLRQGAAATRAAWTLFGFSIVYLFLLFTIIVIERLLAIAGIL